jgi:hypothetical protein
MPQKSDLITLFFLVCAGSKVSCSYPHPPVVGRLRNLGVGGRGQPSVYDLVRPRGQGWCLLLQVQIEEGEHFATLEDPRVERTKRHQFLANITIALCAVICGADPWVDVEELGHAKRAWLETFLDLPNGIPSHDTFGRVFARLDPEQFQACFLWWVQAINAVLPAQQIAIDGKTARRSHERAAGKDAIQMVSAWATASHLVLAQRQVAEHSNEKTALPFLLEQLDLAGCIVSIDAMGCDTKLHV